MKTPFDFPRENNLFQSRLALKDDNRREHEYSNIICNNPMQNS